MSKVVLMLSVSLDGFVEGPNREIDWHLVDDEVHTHFNELLAGMGAFLDGRVTYELMAGFWPTADADPDAPPTVVEFARIWRDMPKVVYSRTLERVDWNSTIAREVTVEGVRELTAQAGGDLAVGGADLAASFMRLDLMDEYRLYVNPIILGQGTPLFPTAETRTKLRLIETRTFGNGLVMLRYARARD